MQIDVKSFEELTKNELYELLALRAEVFVVEQDCAYQDVDGKDSDALHILGTKDEQLVAYARVFKPGVYFEEASIGRIVVKNSHRIMGYGQRIVSASEAAIKNCFHTKRIKLSAQSYLKKFYSDMGYNRVGEEYLEDGIPHLAMVKELNSIK